MSYQINIKTSESNKDVVSKLTRKLGVTTAENMIARIALGYSLQSGKKFTTNEFNNYDSKGKEYKDHTLFDIQYRDFYIALICQHYQVYKTNDAIPKYVKLHIDHGLELLDKLFSDNHYTVLDFLMDHLEKGISYLDSSDIDLGSVKNNNQNIQKNYFSSLIKVEVGNNLKNNEPIYLNLNDISYSNFHIAVAGTTGTGKTRFAFELLSQICEKTNGQANFIYLDFKGLKPEDVEKNKSFFDRTKAEYIDIPQKPFPLNPLTFIDNINDKNKQMGIDKFVDIICKYSGLGIKQRGKLRTATTEAFLDKKGVMYPSIGDINEKLLEIVGDDKDSLTEIISELSRYNIFDQESKNTESFLNKNFYISLSGDLSNAIRFTSLFLIINYLYNTFMNLEDSPIEDDYKAIRYVILIDEAHVVFKEKKYQDLLEKILREIRSKGVIVVLLSQGIEEYNQKSFDFSSLCEIAFLLDIKNKDPKMINKFLGFSEKETVKVARSMENIKKGEAISNIKEFEKAELFKLKQF